MPCCIVTRSTVELQLHPEPSEIDYRAKFETLREITCDIQLITDASFHWNFNPFIHYIFINKDVYMSRLIICILNIHI